MATDRRISRHQSIWRDGEGQPWLVVLDFAELDGRIECIGLQIRSYIEDVEGPDRPFRRRYREPGPPLPVAELAEMIGRWGKGEPPLDFDEDAAVGGAFEETDFAPRALRAATLRGLPVGRLEAKGRHDLATALRIAGRTRLALVKQVWAEWREEFGDEDATVAESARGEIERLSGISRELDQEAKAMESSGRKRGRFPAYSYEELRRVAEIYTAACATSRQPTKDTAAALGLTWSQASKRIMRCRELGLLGKTNPGQAGRGLKD